MKICFECGKTKSKKGKYCKSCGYRHRTRPTGLKYKTKKLNPTSFKKGCVPWNKGLRTPELKGKSYDALHDWVRRIYGSPRICWQCGDEYKERYEWANVSGKYKKDLKDWMRLCRKCHHKFDFLNFGDRKAFYL